MAVPPVKKNGNASRNPEGTPSIPIVALGASAGGMQALEVFFGAVPPGTGIGFVVVTHLSPDHPTLLPEILARHTALPVRLAEDGMMVLPDQVYITPAHTAITLGDGRLRLTEPATPEGRRHPIDDFFLSMARDRGELALAVILSGTGNDGSAGARAIKKGGGFVLVQEPATAAFADMPQSALLTGEVDGALPAEKIPQELIAYFGQFAALGARGRAMRQRKILGILREVGAILRERAGCETSRYKPMTLVRRIERRMLLCGAKDPAAYLALLGEDAEEPHRLLKDFLINVTAFFRDPEAFESLRRQILPGLLRGKAEGEALRLWVPACSTGEEAYSLAILVRETMEAEGLSRPVQIFATDLNPDVIARARAGVYPAPLARRIAPERLRKYFRPLRDSYQVGDEIRQTIVFAVHNVLEDPPFSRLDLVSCRNLLIYVDKKTQERVLSRFYQALRGSGTLLLGHSESTNARPELFEPVDKKWKIYRRGAGAAPEPREIFLPGKPLAPAGRGEGGGTEPPTVAALGERALLRRYAPPSLIVNRRHEIVHTFGPLSPYLDPPQGQWNADLFKLVRRELRPVLRAALHQVFSEQRPCLSRNVRLGEGEGADCASLEVSPLEPGGRDLALVSFAECRRPAEEGPQILTSDDLLRQLEEQLRTVTDQLYLQMEDWQRSDEALKASNEELMSMNEELQSANEELETSKDELQAMSEELVTVNTELQEKVQELDRTNSDIRNLINSTRIPTVFLDRELAVRRFTPAAAELFNLIAGDLGRPLGHLASNLEYPQLEEDARRVLRHLTVAEREIRDRGGRHYLVRALPYRAGEEVIGGVVLTFTDVTARKEAEAAVRENEERFRAIFEQAAVGIGHADLGGRWLRVNRKLCDITGYPREELLNRNFQEITHPEDLESDLQQYQALLAGTIDTYAGEKRYLRRDGQPVWVNLTVSLQRDAAGRPLHLIKVVEDITARKQTERELYFFNYLTERSSDPFYIVSPTAGFRLVYVNEAACRHFGRGREELLAMSVSDFDAHFPPERVAEFWEGLKERRSMVYETVHRHADGHDLPVEVSASYFEYEGLELFAGWFHDITLRRWAEQALVESEEQFRVFFDNAAVGAAEIDREGRFVRVNEQLSRITGFSREELLRMPPFALAHPEDRERNLEEQAVFRSGQDAVREAEQRYIRQDGRVIWVQATTGVIHDAEGRPVRLAAIVQDITERKRIEEELQFATAAAEEATRAKSEFLANMSHEIRTPMTVFMSALEYLLAVDHDPERRQLLEMAGKSGERLRLLIEDILDFSRIEARHLEIQAIPFDPRGCVRGAVDLLALPAREKNLRLQVAVAPRVPPIVAGDPDRLSQVLVNLVGNAVKFTERGEVKVTVKVQGGTLRFAVSDTGIGVPEEKRSLLFESFSQLDSSRTRRHGGTGLGLAISKGLVELMGGRIGMRGREGGGSVFFFTIPLRTAGAGAFAPEERPAEEPAAAGLRILLAEDDPAVRKMIRMILEKRGWPAAAAVTGREAVAKWREGNFDLVLMDVQMPEMDGLQAARTIREMERDTGGRTCIIGLTAHARREMEEECRAAGMDGYLTKPVRLDDLYSAIEACFRRVVSG